MDTWQTETETTKGHTEKPPLFKSRVSYSSEAALKNLCPNLQQKLKGLNSRSGSTAHRPNLSQTCSEQKKFCLRQNVRKLMSAMVGHVKFGVCFTPRGGPKGKKNAKLDKNANWTLQCKMAS